MCVLASTDERLFSKYRNDSVAHYKRMQDLYDRGILKSFKVLAHKSNFASDFTSTLTSGGRQKASSRPLFYISGCLALISFVHDTPPLRRRFAMRSARALISTSIRYCVGHPFLNSLSARTPKRREARSLRSRSASHYSHKCHIRSLTAGRQRRLCALRKILHLGNRRNFSDSYMCEKSAQ